MGPTEENEVLTRLQRMERDQKRILRAVFGDKENDPDDEGMKGKLESDHETIESWKAQMRGIRLVVGGGITLFGGGVVGLVIDLVRKWAEG